MDLVFSVERFPLAGETILSTNFSTFFGGKGGNQAVALGKLGANVQMVGKVGDRQFFMDLPTALLEAARIDGASWWRIYYKVAIPLCKPVTISASLLIFISQWESFMWPLLVSRSKEYRVIQVAMSYFVTEHATFWNEMFAASILAIIIPLCLVLPFQHYFVQGVTNTGGKE